VGQQEVVAAASAPGPSEPVSQNPALPVAPELRFHLVGYAVAHRVSLVAQGEVGLRVAADHAAWRSGLGAGLSLRNRSRFEPLLEGYADGMEL
jgi:hypothetical protein